MYLKKYNCWIEKDQTESSPISGWYFECKVGARTDGCSVHFASVLWYLDYACNQSHTPVPSKTHKFKMSPIHLSKSF